MTEMKSKEEQCSCIWPEVSEDFDMGHLNDTVHQCMFNRERHPVADVMAIGAVAGIQLCTDAVRVHKCKCGIQWLERTKLERRIQ